jgi:hypothetical protein
MKIKRKALTFHNLLHTTKICPPDEWYTIALALRDVVITRGLYINAPIIYTSTPVDGEQNEYTVYVPINAELTVEPEMPFEFMKELYINDAFVFRLVDLEEPGEAEAYILLDTAAESQDCRLMRPFYNVVLNIFDEVALDIVAPVEESTNQENA